MIQFPHLLRLEKRSIRLPHRLVSGPALTPIRKRCSRALRVAAPTLVALSFAGIAHAQGTMDFSGAQTLMGTFNTIVVSPDNASRRQINQAVRSELQALGTVASEDHAMRVLATRSDMTGPDRTWAARYSVDDVLYYPRGSQDIGIEKQSYMKVVAAHPKDNLLTVQKEDGTTVTYNPARLYGVSVYRELEREFAIGDRLSFTAPSKKLGVANRDLGTVQSIDKDGQLTVKMDNGKAVNLDANQMRHLDHGYAVTSHSSQGLTADRVLVNIDTEVHPDLINSRFAYVSLSRASQDAQIYTSDASSLATVLSHGATKTSAVEIARHPDVVQSVVLTVGNQPNPDIGTGFSL